MRTLGEAAIALLKMSGFPLYLWEHAYACVVYVKNRTVSHSFFIPKDRFRVPFERVHNIKASFHGMIRFGAKCYVFVDKDQMQRSKLDSHCWIGQNCLYGYHISRPFDSETMPMIPPCCIPSSFRGLPRL